MAEPRTLGMILAEPWDWIRLGSDSSELRVGDTVAVSGGGNPCCVVPAHADLRIRGQRCPELGPRFADGQGRWWSLRAMPGELQRGTGRKDLELEWSLDGHRGLVCQRGFLSRPGEGADDANDQLDACILWALGRFQELAHGGHGAPCGGVTRCTWASARTLWWDYRADEPRMDLIVRLAQSAKLCDALDSVARQPRRILERVRQETRVAYVQELDAACIRDYARRPGRTAIEKAGSRQSLLAVRRQVSTETLENRVSAWTLDELHRSSRAWLHRHKQFASDKSEKVGILHRRSRNWRRQEALAEISVDALIHPVQANYPLLFESRYREIHTAYVKLLRQHKEEDDAWTWRRVLWSDAVRQLVALVLLDLEQSQCREAWTSEPYYRQESAQGSWLAYPSVPGPLKLADGRMWYVLDQRELQNLNRDGIEHLPEPWMAQLGALGADVVLWSPEAHRLVPIWSILDTENVIDDQRTERAAEALARWLRWPGMPRRLSAHGVIVATSLADSEVDLRVSQTDGAEVSTLLLPLRLADQKQEDYQKRLRNFAAGIALAMKSGAS